MNSFQSRVEKMKFKLDENIPISVIQILKNYGFNDVETVYSEELAGKKIK